MSEKLVYLVIDRAPLRGVPYWTLLHVAHCANDKDISYASGVSAAQGCRIHLQRAQEALQGLCKAGYLHRLRYGAVKNKNDGYYIVCRENLICLPSVHIKRHKFAGKTREHWEGLLSAETTALLADRLDLLDRFAKLQQGEHLPFLKNAAAKMQGFPKG